MKQTSTQIGGRTIQLSDIDQLAGLFDRWQGRFEQISSGRFDATLKVVQGRVLRVFDIRANQRVRVRGHDAAGLFQLHPVTAGSAASLWQGRELSPGQEVLNGPCNEVNFTSPRKTAHFSVSLTPSYLEESVRILLKSDDTPLPTGWAAMTPTPASMIRQNQLLAEFVHLGLSSPKALNTPAGDQLEQECVRAVVAGLTTAITYDRDLSLPARHRLVQQAEEMMRADLISPLSTVELCRRLRVSDRTLRLAFRERYGLGPMAYYKRIRLNAVRVALRSEPLQSVAMAAMAYGFHHLGNFAADYRRLFGEKPSETTR